MIHEFTMSGLNDADAQKVWDMIRSANFCDGVTVNARVVAAATPAITPSAAVPPASPGTNSTLEKIRGLKQRCTRTNGAVWALVHAIASNCQAGVPFTLRDLARFAGMPYEDAWARFRVLGRPEKALNVKVLNKIPNTSPTQYSMTQAMRDAILEVGT